MEENANKENKNNKVRGIVTIIVLIAAAVILFGGKSFWDGAGSGEHIGISTEPTLDSINIKWKKQDDVQFFEVYRVDITDTEEGYYPAFDEYEKIATVLGDEKSYDDTDVETGRTYGYVVSGFYRSFGHTKQVCTSYIEDDVTYEVAGLAKPVLLNNGEGENYENSKDELHLYLEAYSGVEPEGVELYRKGSKDEDFALIDCELEDGCEITDDSVTPGETYNYKARTFVTEKGEKTYSPFSDELTISAVNLFADYDVKVLGSKGDTFAIEVTSRAYNGITSFDASMPAQYSVQKDKKSGRNVFAASLTGFCKSYSGDKTEWQDVPKKGVKIKAGESVCLQYKLSIWEGYVDDENEISEDVYFGGSDAVESYLTMDGSDSGGAKYYGSGAGVTVMGIDLVKGTGHAYCDFD